MFRYTDRFVQREEKFFSRAVTHVVTTRAIPPEYLDSASAESTAPSSATTETPPIESQPQTINPSLLEKSSENISSQTNAGLLNVKFPFETSHARRQLPAEPDMRRENSTKNDVLLKARHFQMKIWALEKLNRMMQTLIDAETSQHGHNTRSHSVNSVGAGKASRENDLSQILRNERIHGPMDRDASVVTKDLVYFRGPYIYVHDIDEKTRPVMVREYQAVSHRRDGEWPQFRSAPQGKCPFVEDPAFVKDLEEDRKQERAERKARLLAQQQQQQQQSQEMPKTRSTTIAEPKMEPPARRSVLREVIDQVNRNAPPEKRMPIPKCLQDAQPPSLKHGSSAKGSENFPPPTFGARPRIYGGEPAASGVQPSNITSAIRSQMISSTAAAPGVKAGTSKEVQELKRKVLERSTSGLSIPSVQSQRMTDIAGTLRKSNPPTTREAKRKAQEKLGLGQINEEGITRSDEEDSQKRVAVIKAPRKKAAEKRDPKPGYCENCRDKFDDFDEVRYTSR
jgi:regulatory subunit for Cdc7p protein kinase